MAPVKASMNWLKVGSTPRACLVARIGETGIGIHAPPRRIHCGLPTQVLLFSHSGGGLQHQHLVRGDRETSNLILWLLGSSRARSIEHDNWQYHPTYMGPNWL